MTKIERPKTGSWLPTRDTSRELDPQLHTHAVAANLTYDGTEARWKALQASGLYERRSYLTEVYRNALSREVRALGYEIENRRDVAGKDKEFEIASVSQKILDNYSRRSAQRDAAIQEFSHTCGRAPTDNEVGSPACLFPRANKRKPGRCRRRDRTQASLLRERDIVAVVNRGLVRYDRLGNSVHFEPAPQLRAEQRRAVGMVLDSTDLAINVRDDAGTGKTATLREIDRALRKPEHMLWLLLRLVVRLTNCRESVSWRDDCFPAVAR